MLTSKYSKYLVEYVTMDMAQLLYSALYQVLLNFSQHMTFTLRISSAVRLPNQNYIITKGKLTRCFFVILHASCCKPEATIMEFYFHVSVEYIHLFFLKTSAAFHSS